MFKESLLGYILDNGFYIIALIIATVVIVFMIHKIFSMRKKIRNLEIIKSDLDNEIEERKMAEEKSIRLANIIKHSDDAIISKDLSGYITSWNEGAVSMYGWNKDEIIGKHVSVLYNDTTIHEMDDIDSNMRCGIKVSNMKTERMRKDGKVIYISLTVSPVKNNRGVIVGTSSISRDITKLVKNEQKLQNNYEELAAVHSQLAAAEEELRAQYDELLKREAELLNSEVELLNSEERYKTALEIADNAIVEWDILNNEYYISYTWHSIFEANEDGNKQGEFLDDVKKVIHKEDLDKVKNTYLRYVRSDDNIFECEFRLKRHKDEYKWIYFKGKLVRDNVDKKPVKFIGALTDISASVEYKEKITYLANYDHLTGLPNKESFFKSLEREVDTSLELGNKGALLAIDLDEFKLINDTMGHKMGDKVLVKISQILKEVTGNEYLISRTGGDEYLMLINNLENTNQVVAICRKISEILKNPLDIDGEEIYTGISIGVAIFPDNGKNKDILFKNADTALNESKRSGKNKYTFFDKKLEENIIRRDKIERGLRESLEKDKLQLVYQPKICIDNGTVYGFEALLRWKSDELGWVSPAEFIEVAEERGIINSIGKWVVKEAIRQNEEWKSKGFKYKSISLNVSPTQLKEDGFVDFVRDNIENSDSEKFSIEFEITETNLMENFGKNIEMLEKIRKFGIEISLDDFGTGYSSLSYLKELPISILKIDKSFIDNIEVEYSKRSIVDGIIQLAHKIDLLVVAEGVEKKEQLEILKELQCDVVQGYYYSKPLMPEVAEEEYLKKFNS